MKHGKQFIIKTFQAPLIIFPACYAEPSISPICQARPRLPFVERPEPIHQSLAQALEALAGMYR
jgi:hypothetical protein